MNGIRKLMNIRSLTLTLSNGRYNSFNSCKRGILCANPQNKQFGQGQLVKRGYCSQIAPTEPKTEPTETKTDRGKALSNFDKLCLVKAKMYPNKESIPDVVSYASLHKARDKMRIRICFLMMVATAIGYLGMRQLGLRQAAQGNTAGQLHMEKIAALRKQGKAEEAAAAAAKSNGS